MLTLYRSSIIRSLQDPIFFGNNRARLIQKSPNISNPLENRFRPSPVRVLAYPLSVNEYIKNSRSWFVPKHLKSIHAMEVGEEKNAFINGFLNEMFGPMDHLEKGAEAILCITKNGQIDAASAFIEICLFPFNPLDRREAVFYLLQNLSADVKKEVIQSLSLQARCKLALLKIFH
jgi:hypothetical protein